MWKLSRTLSKLAIRYKKKWLTYFHYWINCRWLLHTLEWTCKNVDLRQSIVSFPHNVFGWINIKVIGEVITSLFYLLIWIWEGGCWKKFDSEQAKVILVNGEYEFCAIFVEDLSIKNVLTALKNNWLSNPPFSSQIGSALCKKKNHWFHFTLSRTIEYHMIFKINLVLFFDFPSSAMFDNSKLSGFHFLFVP